MSFRKSVVYTAVLPRAETDDNAFAAGLSELRVKGVTAVEFYAPHECAARRGEMLAASGMDGIYLAAIHQKRFGFNLSSTDERLQTDSIRATENCIDAARSAGCSRVLITSGAIPSDPAHIPDATDALEHALLYLCDYAFARGIVLTLEPGDRTVQEKQLVGPTPLAVDICRRLRQKGRHLSLTMDSSHLAQLGEDILPALELAKPFCSHIHLANCILKPGHLLYGDKHPRFTAPDGHFTCEELQSLARWCKAFYAGGELTLSFEIICRDINDIGFFDEILREEDWFFTL